MNVLAALGSGEPTRHFISFHSDSSMPHMERIAKLQAWNRTT